jgi:hypothetical protein
MSKTERLERHCSAIHHAGITGIDKHLAHTEKTLALHTRANISSKKPNKILWHWSWVIEQTPTEADGFHRRDVDPEQTAIDITKKVCVSTCAFLWQNPRVKLT